MPNSYATVPNILPGNVTIGGDLTVSGNTIRLGGAAPFVRLYHRSSNFGGGISYNLDALTTTQDQASPNLNLDIVPISGQAISGRFHDGVGGQNFFQVPMVWSWTGVTANVTGTVAETSVGSLSIRGGFLGLFGGVKFWWALNPTAQGGVATTLRIKLGGTVLFSYTEAAVNPGLVSGAMMNQNADNSQRTIASVLRGAGAGVFGDGATAVATASTQTLDFTIQPGAVGDNWNSRQLIVEPVRVGN